MAIEINLDECVIVRYIFSLVLRSNEGIEFHSHAVRIIIGNVPPDFHFNPVAVRKFLETRSLIAVGSSLGGPRGGWLLPIPTRMLNTYVVMQLCSCKTETRYGYRECSYEGKEDDWLYETTASEPCNLVQKVFNKALTGDLQIVLYGGFGKMFYIMNLAS